MAEDYVICEFPDCGVLIRKEQGDGVCMLHKHEQNVVALSLELARLKIRVAALERYIGEDELLLVEEAG